MRILKPFTSVTLLLLAAAPAFAHPGHGEGGGFVAGLLHPFTGIDHLSVMLLVGVWAAFVFPHMIWVLPMSFMAAMVLGFVAGFVVPGLPVELLVWLSMPALLVGLLLGRRVPLWTAATLTALFAIAHGYAHATEASGAAGAFATGMLVATAILHVAGLLVGRGLGRFIAPSLAQTAAARIR